MSDCIQYLGLIIDSNLNWSACVEYKIRTHILFVCVLIPVVYRSLWVEWRPFNLFTWRVIASKHCAERSLTEERPSYFATYSVGLKRTYPKPRPPYLRLVIRPKWNRLLGRIEISHVTVMWSIMCRSSPSGKENKELNWSKSELTTLPDEWVHSPVLCQNVRLYVTCLHFLKNENDNLLSFPDNWV